ncbi:hypothetical protein C8R43DRAFT_96435 [Mycena crocata]|nr:hypothetical protein C8R43DRAFT_96435 [Mycena crocata]
MPNKKNKNKNARNRVVDVGLELPTLSRLLEAAAQSTDLEATIREMLHMPDYHTNNGLRQWHNAFETISSKLEAIFALSRGSQSGNALSGRIAATVIAIYGHGCADTLLRERIFKETEFLQNAVSLLRSDMTGPVIIVVLCQITHTVGVDLKVLAPFIPIILDCVEGRLHVVKLVEGALCVITHSTGAVLKEAHPDPDLAELITDSLPRIIQLYLSVIRLPTSTSFCFFHFIQLCHHTTRHHPDVFWSIPDSVDVLVACTRVKDIRTRGVSLRSVQQLCTPGPGYSIPEPQVRVDLTLGYEKMARLTDEDAERSALIKAFAHNPDRSLSDFGHALVDLIQRNERDVRRYLTKDVELELYVGGSSVKTDLGCTRFVGVLRLCAEAVRCDGSAQADIKGNILHLEFLLASGKAEEACKAARLYIERHPAVGFFHYVLATVSYDKEEISADITCVHFAVRGLQCPNLTALMRDDLRVFFVISSSRIVDEMLNGWPPEVRLQDAFNLAQKARSHINTFIADATSHFRVEVSYMPLMIALNVHLVFLLAGHTLSEDTRELQTPQAKLSLAYTTARTTTLGGFIPPQTCLGIDEIFTRMPNAWRVWNLIVSKLPSQPYSNIDPNVDLVAWLEKIETLDHISQLSEIRGVNRDTGRSGASQIHHCASCCTPSVMLKQCSRCEKARYCNNDCQRRHWKLHRQTCNGSP